MDWPRTRNSDIEGSYSLPKPDHNSALAPGPNPESESAAARHADMQLAGMGRWKAQILQLSQPCFRSRGLGCGAVDTI